MSTTIKALLLEVLMGDGATSRKLPRLARSEDGLITWATLIAVILFVALISIVFNVGRIANDKLEAQNAADSVAYSSSLVQARAMNAITASNHMMGELTAMYTMHHAMIDENTETWNAVTIGLATVLTAVETAAQAAGAISMGFGGSTPPDFGFYDWPQWWDMPYGKATIYDSKCLLKWKLIEEYISHADGSAKVIRGAFMLAPPPFGDSGATYADGLRTQRQASIEINALKREYRIIHQVQEFTRRTISGKEKIPVVMRAIYSYEKLVVQGAAVSCTLAAKRVASANQCIGEVVGRPKLKNAGAALGIPSASLAVVADPTTNPERSQLIRATYPWLRTWREPVLIAAFLGVPRSRATLFYEYHTDRFALKLTSNRLNFKLFVLEQMNASSEHTDKGTEKWRKRSQSRLADEMFAVVGVARRQTPTALSHMNFFMPRTNPTPVTAISQAMIYNANTPTKWTPGFVDNFSLLIHREGQPVPSWDTLNWTEGATEWIEGKPYVGWLEHISRLIPGRMGQYLTGFLSDIRWVAGRLPRAVMDAAYPPDALILPIPTIVPTPEVKLNWQSKLVPIAQDTLFARTFMVSDSIAAKRLRTQVLPVVNPASRALPDMLQPNVINH